MSKTIVVTGASSGFGKQMALKLINKGHRVYGWARRLEHMADIESVGGHPMSVDVSNAKQVDQAMAQVLEDAGHLDVLVNNAGFGIYDFVEHADLDEMRRMFDVNFWGLVQTTQAALPHMRAQRAGRIVNISSLVGKLSTGVIGFYAASKHAVEAISDATRVEVAPFGIKVSVVEPGIFATSFDAVMSEEFENISVADDYQKRLSRFQRFFKKAYAKAPTPEPVVRAVEHAIYSRKPKTRYVVGVDAKAGVAARQWMSDGMFDKMMSNQFKLR